MTYAVAAIAGSILDFLDGVQYARVQMIRLEGPAIDGQDAHLAGIDVQYSPTKTTPAPVVATGTYRVIVTATTKSFPKRDFTAPITADTSWGEVLSYDGTGYEYTPDELARLVAAETGLAAALARIAALEAGGGGDPDPDPEGPTHITATAPTITDADGTTSDVLHLASQTGVIWRINLDDVAAGDHDAADLSGYPDFTVTAVAADGYALDGTTEWSFSFSTTSDSVFVTDFHDAFTADQDPLVLPRTPDTVGAVQWQGTAAYCRTSGGSLVVDDPNGSGQTINVLHDYGALSHVVEVAYDLSAVPANGNAQYNSLVAMVASTGNRSHQIMLTGNGTGTLTLSGTGTEVGALTFTAQGGANLSALPAVGIYRVAVSGPTITISVNGTDVATTPRQDTVAPGSTATKYGFGIVCYTPGPSDQVLKIGDVVLGHYT